MPPREEEAQGAGAPLLRSPDASRRTLHLHVHVLVATAPPVCCSLCPRGVFERSPVQARRTAAHVPPFGDRAHAARRAGRSVAPGTRRSRRRTRRATTEDSPRAPPSQAPPVRRDPVGRSSRIARWSCRSGIAVPCSPRSSSRSSAGWLLGTLATPHGDERPVCSRVARAVGLGGARLRRERGTVRLPELGSRSTARSPSARRRSSNSSRTKATRATLTLPDLGSAKFPVVGGERREGDAHADAQARSKSCPPIPTCPSPFALDGRTGYAPIEKFAPVHEVQFSGRAWRRGRRTSVSASARPCNSRRASHERAPGTGVLQVQATINDDEGASPLSRARRCSVDGIRAA